MSAVDATMATFVVIVNSVHTVLQSRHEVTAMDAIIHFPFVVKKTAAAVNEPCFANNAITDGDYVFPKARNSHDVTHSRKCKWA